MKTKLFLILVVISVALMSSCKTTRIIPEEPVVGNLTERPERLNSQISLPMEIDIKAIENYINEKLPNGEIAKGKGEKGNSTKYSYNIYIGINL